MDADYNDKIIVYDLVIVMNDGTWFERNTQFDEYWWEYKKTPEKQEARPFTEFLSDSFWTTIKMLERIKNN